MFIIKRGRCRIVILTYTRAYKIPRIGSGVKIYLEGLRRNRKEAKLGKLGHPMLAPVLFSLFGGGLVVQPHCIVNKDGAEIDYWFDMAEQDDSSIDLKRIVCRKPTSVGKYQGRLVAVEYGN